MDTPEAGNIKNTEFFKTDKRNDSQDKQNNPGIFIFLESKDQGGEPEQDTKGVEDQDRFGMG